MFAYLWAVHTPTWRDFKLPTWTEKSKTASYTEFAAVHVLVIILNFTQSKVILEEETSVEKLPSIRLVCEKLSWFWKIDWCERAQFIVGGGSIPGQVCWCCAWKLFEHEQKRKSIKAGFFRGFSLKLLPWVPALTPFRMVCNPEAEINPFLWSLLCVLFLSQPQRINENRSLH